VSATSPSVSPDASKTRDRASSFHKCASFRELDNDTEDAMQGVATESSKGTPWVALGLEQPLVIAMVGLPARGKSYIVNMVLRYLKWIGYDSRVFNVGSYRRKMGLQSADANFFDASNEEGKRMREELADAVQNSMYEWLHNCPDPYNRRVAVFDATNTTIKRRQSIAHKAREQKVCLVFVESICNDQEVLDRNYNLKLQNDDYAGMDPAKAKADFLDRVHAYEKVYEVSRNEV
jgi:6-phosphofructo-2-kinase